MILYHGTSTEYLEAILRDGLQPRNATQRPSNWLGQIESKPGFVYLSDAYPVYYANNPALGHEKSDSHILILKVDVDESDLYPDEDFIAWSMERGGVNRPTKELIAEIDPTDYQHHWRHSLEYNGTACIGAVSPERILSHRIIDRKNFRLLMAIGGDASPTPINYIITGGLYRRSLEALFDEGEEAAFKAAVTYWQRGEAS